VSRSRRKGFTLIELIITMMIVAMLSSIAVPKFREVRRRALAAQIMGDFDVLRHAAMSFYVDSGYFPEPVGPGQAPPGLVRYLPNQFDLARPQWTMNYESWTAGEAAVFEAAGTIVGITVTTPDENLGRTAMALIGNAPAFAQSGNSYTFLISGF
jgi:prepilin-type N-terminal cleavage/methylation domain-containing protein